MSDYSELKDLKKECEGTLSYMRSTYARISQGPAGRDDFFQLAVLRALSAIIKLLMWKIQGR